MALKRTAFFEAHQACGARLIDFGGWEMPVQYAGILAEHQAVRSGVGLFDVSHMGEVFVSGPGAMAALNRLLCNDVSTVEVGQSQYSAILNERGGIVDDVFVYRLEQERYLVCVNASNRDKDFEWLVAHNPDPAVSIVNASDLWAQVAIQGRDAIGIVAGLSLADTAGLERGAITETSFAGVDGCLVARTGYTGEDGYEVFIPVDEAPPTWDRILEAGQDKGIQPIGLGARDTLRLEVKNVLYGNDINDDTSPLEAGLRWITKLDKADFIGRQALLEQKEAGLSRRLVCLEIEGRIARPHASILKGDEAIGEVTSGTRSPSLGTNIAMGYVSRGNGRPGTELVVDIRGRQAKAQVVKGPFYKRDY
jgi:aminomethyltransferase